MDNNNNREHYMRQLTGYAYPLGETLGNTQERVQRRWIVRTKSVLPSVTQVNKIAAMLTEQARQCVIDNYGEFATEEELKINLPSVNIVCVDDHHIVVETEFPAPGFSIGDVALIATWHVLHLLDEQWEIDDLEGIPKRFWFTFRP